MSKATRDADDHRLLRVPLDQIRSDPDRARRELSRESIERLAESIRLHGQLSPLLVRELGGCEYRLIAGERRLRALRLLNRGWAEAIALTSSACDCALIALVENLQREALHYLDAAAACRSILDRFPITQERLAASLSTSPSALANRLRLLRLPDSVQAAVRGHGLSERHARALLRLRGEQEQLALAAQAAEARLSAQQLERRIDERLASAGQLPRRPQVGEALRDNRIVVNAVLDTVRKLSRIGVPVTSRVEEGDGVVNVIVTIKEIPHNRVVQ